MTTLSQIFALIEFVLRALKIWDGFLDWLTEKHSAEIDARAEARRQAVEKSKQANTDDEIWQSQEDITKNLPAPP